MVGPSVIQVQGLERLGLRGLQESGELRQVDARTHGRSRAGIAGSQPAPPYGAGPPVRMPCRTAPAGACRSGRHDQVSRPFSLVSVFMPRPPRLASIAYVSVISSSSRPVPSSTGPRARGSSGRSRRRLAHVHLAGDDIGDQAGAVLAKEESISPCAAYDNAIVGPSPVEVDTMDLFFIRWSHQRNLEELVGIECASGTNEYQWNDRCILRCSGLTRSRRSRTPGRKALAVQAIGAVRWTNDTVLAHDSKGAHPRPHRIHSQVARTTQFMTSV